MVFLDFEQPLESLFEQLETVKTLEKEGDIDVSDKIKELEAVIRKRRKEIFSDLTRWQKVQLSRHPARPYTLYYIEQVFKKFTELFGDRKFGDDKAIVGGLAQLDNQTVMVIGHQKGVNTKMRQYRNFGMASPEGYRKAERLMRLAEKFNIPVVTLIDTPGAYPGIEAEERGQAEAIAKSLMVMAELKVPILCYVIGEGASGGALGIGLGNRIFMLEYTWYTVISPESCSSILWHSWDYKEQAAELLKLTSDDMLEFGLIDGVLKEPIGGAHSEPDKMARALKKHIKSQLDELASMTADELIDDRIQKFNSMGRFKTKKSKVSEV